ncbi:MAG: hypothetical protein MI717_05250 [Spirochaetales bacterium]|nr:hypothetical protein [Spirochaetales bacterium]
MRHERYSLLILLIFSLLPPLLGQERIEWSQVENAAGYDVEIRKDGDLVLRTQTQTAMLPLFLMPGEYEFRVTALDAFGKPARVGEWSTLRIITPPRPFILNVTPNHFIERENPPLTLRVQGHISPTPKGSIYQIQNLEGRTIPLNILESKKREGERGWSDVMLQAKRAPTPGRWRLSMENPDGQISLLDDAIEVVDFLRPRIRSVSPRLIPENTNAHVLTIKGSGWDEEVVLTVEGPEALPLVELQREGDEGQYILDLTKAIAGEYTIVASNPSGEQGRKENAFEVTQDSLEFLRTQQSENNQETKSSDKKAIFPLPPHHIRAGASTFFPFGNEEARFYGRGFYGASLSYAKTFEGPPISRAPFFQELAWTIGTHWTRQPGSHPVYNIRIDRFDLLLGLSYSTPFRFPLNILVNTSIGFGYSYYTATNATREQDLGNFTLKSLDSIDASLRLGAGLRIRMGRHFYLDLLCDLGAIFYYTHHSWFFSPHALVGVRW